MLADPGQDLAVRRVEELDRAPPQRHAVVADGDHPPGPVEEARLRLGLRLDVDRVEAVDRILDRGQEQFLGVGAGEAAVAVRAPLHRRAHAVAVAEIDVVAHADLVAIVEHRRAGHRQDEGLHQFDLAPVVLEERREAAADAEVDPRPALGGVERPEVVTLLGRDHFQRQLVVVAQEDGPLAALRDLRGLAHDVGDRVPVLAGDRHVHARHEREVERHVAFVAVAEILRGLLRPLVGLGQQHPVGIALIEGRTDRLDDVVGLLEVLAIRAVALDQVGDRVEAQPVDAHVEPVAHGRDDRFQHLRVVEVQVGLVAVETVPEILLGDRVPGPVRGLGVEEDDARVLVRLVGIRPDVEVALRRAGGRLAGGLEPGMLVRGVVDDELGDDAQAALVGGVHEGAELLHRPVGGVDALVIGDVVAIIAERRGVERHQPDRRDAEVADVIEPLRQPLEVADPVIVRVEERLDVDLVDDGVPVPLRIAAIDHRVAASSMKSKEPAVQTTGGRAAVETAAGATGGLSPQPGVVG